jgi:hypothetical protein
MAKQGIILGRGKHSESICILNLIFVINLFFRHHIWDVAST